MSEGKKNCHHHSPCCPAEVFSSVAETLDELDFNRGPWSAALNGDTEKLKNILNHKIYHPDSVDSSGYTPLHYAARAGHLAVVHHLHSQGCNLNARTRAGGATAMHRAAQQGHIQIVNYLLRNGADSSLHDFDGLTALQRAIQSSQSAVVELLTTHNLT